MVMTDEQKYSEVLKALGEVLAENSVTISTQSWQIVQLKEKLAAAEKEADERAFLVSNLIEISDVIRDSIDLDKGVIYDVDTLLELQSSIRILIGLDNEKGGAA